MRFILFIFLLLSISAFAQEQVLTLYFDHDSHSLNSSEKSKLDKFFHNELPFDLKSIIAYCDTTGSSEYNKSLADKRLQTVKQLFSVDQLNNTNLVASGENYPIQSNKTIELREWRKVEIHYFHPQDSPITEEPSTASFVSKTSVFDQLTLIDVIGEESEAIVLDLQFFPGMDVLFNESWGEVDRLFQFMRRNENAFAFIRGHVCCGSDMYLSYARAYVVYNSLIQRGISPKRLDIKGFDNTLPRVWPEVTDEDRQKNRRVDVIFSLIEKSE
jgi:outer membrane protein OmpA-like peptidoglycan-associated protein